MYNSLIYATPEQLSNLCYPRGALHSQIGDALKFLVLAKDYPVDTHTTKIRWNDTAIPGYDKNVSVIVTVRGHIHAFKITVSPRTFTPIMDDRINYYDCQCETPDSAFGILFCRTCITNNIKNKTNRILSISSILDLRSVLASSQSLSIIELKRIICDLRQKDKDLLYSLPCPLIPVKSSNIVKDSTPEITDTAQVSTSGASTSGASTSGASTSGASISAADFIPVEEPDSSFEFNTAELETLVSEPQSTKRVTFELVKKEDEISEQSPKRRRENEIPVLSLKRPREEDETDNLRAALRLAVNQRDMAREELKSIMDKWREIRSGIIRFDKYLETSAYQ